MNSIGIIGGGITGLTAAFRLKRGGVPVTVYEAGSRLGGPVHSISKDGYLAEFGPNTLLETSTAVSSLIADLGIESRRIYADQRARFRFVVRGGKPIPIPTSPPAFLRSKLFRFGAKMRLLREPFIGRSKEADESIADFVRRRLGSEFLDYAINPFVAGVYAGDPEALSVRYAIPKIHALENQYGSLIKGQIRGRSERRKSGTVARDRARMLSFDDGLGVLIESLGQALRAEIKLNSPVERIEKIDGGWNIHFNDNGTHYIRTHGRLILAAPAYSIATLAHNVGGADLSILNKISYPPVTCLALGFKRSDVEHSLGGFGMLVPEVEHFHILGTLFSSTLFGGRAPKDHVLLSSYIGGARNPELGRASESEQVQATLADLRILLGVTGEPTFVHRVCWPKAIPQYQVGYGRYYAAMEAFEAKAPGLHIAGNFRGGISLGDCIANADALALAILHER